ncbi:MAG: AMP-binding protein [Burkholderiales bacterium]|nr:AMP-binding protein [Burkholderiales bacterium]
MTSAPPNSIVTASTPTGASLADVFAAHVAQQPDAPLLLAPETGHRHVYAALERDVAALDTFLTARGVGAGGHVAFLLPNGLATTSIFLATMLCARVSVPLNLLSQAAQLAYVLAHSATRLVFVSREHEAVLHDAVARCAQHGAGPLPTVLTVDVDQPLAAQLTANGAAPDQPTPPGVPAARCTPRGSEAALLMYTSGTTGQPKGALLTHRNLLHAARTVAAWHSLTPSDRVLSSLPLYHINGQCIATLAPFVSGGSIVAPHRFSASAWWGWVDTWQPTWINVVPTIIAYLLNAATDGEASEPARPFIRFARSASAPLPPDQHRAFERRFGIGVIEAMGMTECASVVFCNPQDAGHRKYGTPGLPCGVDARVVAVDSGDVLPNGATGELQLRGDNVMAGYWNAPEKTAEALTSDGWLRTGDLGHRDGDGFYFVTGRIKELIIKGGENIAPREIDEALLAHPAVLEAAAVGIPDKNYGQDILAAVVLKPGASADEAALREHCIAQLGRYKTPAVFRFVDELPKGPSGKVQRLKLLDILDKSPG